MDVFVCGFNVFNQLNWDANNWHESDRNTRESTLTKDNESLCEDRLNGQSSMVLPTHRLSLPSQVKAEDIDISFTWSRCVINISKGKGKSIMYITGYKAKTKKNPEIAIENSVRTETVDGSGSILLWDRGEGSDSHLNKISVLPNGCSHPVTVAVSCSEENNVTNIQHISGGYKDVYAVYDGVSFGRFRLPSELQPSPQSDGDSNESNSNVTALVRLRMEHIDFVTPIKEISCGKEHVLLLSASGGVYSYGLSSRGQLGHGDIEKESLPRLVDALDGLAMQTVVAGGWHSVAVSAIGDMYMWGWNESGQLGLASVKKAGENKLASSQSCCDEDDQGSVGIVSTPICLDTPNGENVIDVACGSRHTVILTERGQIFTCGWNAYGQLGLGDTNNRHGLTRVKGLTGHRVFAGGHWNTAIVGKVDSKPCD